MAPTAVDQSCYEYETESCDVTEHFCFCKREKLISLFQSEWWPWEDKHDLCWGFSAHPRSELWWISYVQYMDSGPLTSLKLLLLSLGLSLSFLSLRDHHSSGWIRRSLSFELSWWRVRTICLHWIYWPQSLLQWICTLWTGEDDSGQRTQVWFIWAKGGFLQRILMMSDLSSSSGTPWLRETSTTWKKPGWPTFTCHQRRVTWRSSLSWSVTQQTAAPSTLVRLQLQNCPSLSTRYNILYLSGSIHLQQVLIRQKQQARYVFLHVCPVLISSPSPLREECLTGWVRASVEVCQETPTIPSFWTRDPDRGYQLWKRSACGPRQWVVPFSHCIDN